MKTKKISLRWIMLAVLALSLPNFISPQSIRRSVGLTNQESKKVNSTVSEKFRKVPQKQTTSKIDTIYCTQTKKQHGWFLPLDTISKEMASHRNLSCRFTHRYPSGYWGKMEIVNGYGNLIPGVISPYIVKLGSADTDSAVNRQWIEKLQSGCSYEFIADPSGKKIIQERAYDKDGNIVYTFSRVPITVEGKNYFIGSYKDSHGLPAEMRKDSLFTYGTLVRLTEDRWGNDSVVEYIDSKGNRKLNSDGVAMEVYIYDRYGHLLKQQSRDKNGNLTIDNCGNCGIEYVWDDKHQVISATYMDNHWQPMRMPNYRTSYDNNVIKKVYKYNQNKMLTEEAYYTADDIPDCNESGIFRMTMEYDDKGNPIRKTNYNQQGDPTEDVAGKAFESYEYDTIGRISKAVFLDKNREPCSNSDYLSKIINKYDGKGNPVLIEQYYVINGKEVYYYKEKHNKDCDFYLYSDGSYQIDSLDAKGRLILRSYYDKNGNLKNNTEKYAVNKMKYTDYPHGYRLTSSYYNADGILCAVRNCAIQVTERDSLPDGNVDFIQMYDEHKRLNDCYIHLYDKEGNLIGQNDANAFGKICRAGGSSSVRHYLANVAYSCDNSLFSTFIGRDEFGEPDYIVSPYAIYYYHKLSAKDESLFLDENSQIITDFDTFKDQCPKLMTIEVIDSAAYELGIRDNDVILVDGDYSADVFTLDSTYIDLSNFICNWSVHSVLNGNKNRSMLIFRVDPETLDYGLVKIDNLKGSPSELGYLTHIRYLTNKQVKRIQKCVRDNLMSEHPLMTKEEMVGKDYSGNNSLVVAYTDLYRSERYSPYAITVTDPSILLALCVKEGNMSWKLGESSVDEVERILSTRNMNTSKYPVEHFYLTRNNQNLINMKNDNKYISIHTRETLVSDEVIQKLSTLSGKANTLLAKEMEDAPKLKEKTLFKNWYYKDTNNQYGPQAQISFLKNGQMRGYVEWHDSIVFSDVTFIFKIKQKLNGTWAVHGSILELTYQDDNPIDLTCVELSNVPSNLKDELKDLADKAVQSNPQDLLNMMTITGFGTLIPIRELSKKRLIIDTGIAEGMILSPLSKRELKQLSEHKKEQQKIDLEPAKPLLTFKRPEGEAKKLVGTWKCELNEDPPLTRIFIFDDDGKVHLNLAAKFVQAIDDQSSVVIKMKAQCEGAWSFSNNIVSIRFDPSLNKVQTNLDLMGLEGEKKELVLETIRADLEKIIPEIETALFELVNNDTELEIQDLTEAEFISDEQIFARITISDIEQEQ
jgi:hypothetical protein